MKLQFLLFFVYILVDSILAVRNNTLKLFIFSLEPPSLYLNFSDLVKPTPIYFEVYPNSMLLTLLYHHSNVFLVSYLVVQLVLRLMLWLTLRSKTEKNRDHSQSQNLIYRIASTFKVIGKSNTKISMTEVNLFKIFTNAEMFCPYWRSLSNSFLFEHTIWFF